MQKRFVFLLVFIFVVSLFLAHTSSAIDVYTFKKDRVDQEITGNQGYISGNPPKAPDTMGRKRTLIGVDVELPVTSQDIEGEEEYVSPAQEKKTLPEKKAKEVKEKAVKETEEDWIK